MTDFKVGDEVRVVSNSASRRYEISGSSAPVGRQDYITDGPSSITGRFKVGEGVGNWAHPEDLELVTQPEPSEKMIPASKVREIARLYAKRHGWCDVVDDALKEMGAQDDSIVEVTYTQTRTVRLRRSDLDMLVSTNDLHSLQSNTDRRAQMFRGRTTPTGASLTSKWEVSEPVEIEADGEWTNCTDKPAVGSSVRVRPGTTAASLYGDPVLALTEGRVDSLSADERSRVLVNLPTMGRSLQLRYTDLQVRSS